MQSKFLFTELIASMAPAPDPDSSNLDPDTDPIPAFQVNPVPVPDLGFFMVKKIKIQLRVTDATFPYTQIISELVSLAV